METYDNIHRGCDREKSFFSKNVTKGHGDETGFCGFVVKKSKNVDSELQLPELKLRWC